MTDATEPTADHLDGSAAAGPLSELFALDVTAAEGRCGSCGAEGVMAETRVYVDAPGLVVRCRGCDGVLLRVVQRPDGTYLDVHGLDHLVFRRPDA